MGMERKAVAANRPGKVAVAMLGARMHYAVPAILNDLGLLERLYTDSYIGNKAWLKTTLQTVPKAFGGDDVARFLGREDRRIPGNRVTSFDMFGISYAFARRRARSNAELSGIFADYAARFNAKILSHGFGEASSIWGFNTASAEIFRAAKAAGLTTILEQTILPNVVETRLLRELNEEWAGWQPGFHAVENALQPREADEWDHADHIVAGSGFVADGLAACGVDMGKIAVIPYGVDTVRFRPAEERDVTDGALRILFVGEVGLRKGAPYLLNALKQIAPGRVKAKFVGHIALDRQKLAAYEDVAEFLGPLPRAAMPDLFRWADIFVLPSVVEGSATSTYEALLSGLAVVTTPNAGSIVKDRVNGRIIKVRETSAIVRAIEEYCDDRDILRRHRAAARLARDEASLDRYAMDLGRFFGDERLGGRAS